MFPGKGAYSMYYHNFSLKLALAAALLLTGTAAHAQITERPWYVGAQVGTSFGQSTFSSITEHGMYWGMQGGLFGGYRFNPVFSLEASFQVGDQPQAALDCCPYWLSADGERFMTAVLDGKGWYYKDLFTNTSWGRAALQANINLIGIFAKSSRWSLNLSPQIAAVTTQTRLTTPDSDAEYAGRQFPRQWHFGYGGQASLGFRVHDRATVALYGGVSSLTGERFDNMPYHGHDTNLIWDAGLKLSFHLGKYPKKGPGAEELAAEAEAARIAAEAEAEAARLARARREAEQLERAKLEEARLAAEAAEREATERAAREAAEAEERAFRTPIPTVYFAKNSKTIPAYCDPALEEALAILQQYPDFKLEIHAYASPSGTKSFNKVLSRMRMESVRKWFAARGISMDRMTEAYYHGVDYKARTATQARRAELKFVK